MLQSVIMKLATLENASASKWSYTDAAIDIVHVLQVMACRVVASEERACRICHSRVGSKMFAVYPNGVLACFKCFRSCDPCRCPITGRQFDQVPSSSAEQWADLQ